MPLLMRCYRFLEAVVYEMPCLVLRRTHAASRLGFVLVFVLMVFALVLMLLVLS